MAYTDSSNHINSLNEFLTECIPYLVQWQKPAAAAAAAPLLMSEIICHIR